MNGLQLERLAETAVLVHADSLEVTALVEAMHKLARLALATPGIVDVVPATTSVLLRFEPSRWPGAGVPLQDAVERLATAAREESAVVAVGKLHEIPVCYGGSAGPDLGWMADTTGLSEGEVVAIHAAAEYRVEMLGFAPGFAYLGGLDARLHVPRRDQPRSRVPAGSVAIAGNQTAVYPRATPGGWRIIGHADALLFDPANEARPSLLMPGDSVRFVPVADTP